MNNEARSNNVTNNVIAIILYGTFACLAGVFVYIVFFMDSPPTRIGSTIIAGSIQGVVSDVHTQGLTSTRQPVLISFEDGRIVRMNYYNNRVTEIHTGQSNIIYYNDNAEIVLVKLDKEEPAAVHPVK